MSDLPESTPVENSLNDGVLILTGWSTVDYEVPPPAETDRTKRQPLPTVHVSPPD